MRHIEEDIQAASVKWFSYQYQELKRLLVAIPNGGHRNVREASRLKKGGVVSGVSDLVLFVPNNHFHALLIEMKAPTGKQTALQASWQVLAEAQGYKYIVCRSFDQFKSEIENYLSQR